MLTAVHKQFLLKQHLPLPVYLHFVHFVIQCLDESTLMSVGELEAQLAFWRRQLAYVPPLLSLPTDYPRQAGEPGEAKSVLLVLPAGLVAQLKNVANAAGVSPFMALLAVWQVDVPFTPAHIVKYRCRWIVILSLKSPSPVVEGREHYMLLLEADDALLWM